MKTEQLQELLLQGLETEQGGVQVYSTALKCVQNDDLREEWEQYLEQTNHHVEVLTDVLTKLGIDPRAESPGRRVVGHIGESLVGAMELAMASGPPEAAELVAAECVTLAESKDHLNWGLIKIAAKNTDKATAKVLTEAFEKVEDEEDEHLYHTTGWARELWIQFLGIKAVLPPPEERKHVKSAIGAARAKNARDEMK